MSYVYLAIAIAAEITATTMLRATHGFTRPLPSAVVIVCVCLSLYFFSRTVETLSVSYVYAVWSGVGITAVCILGWLIYGQKLDAPAIIGIALITVGIVVMNLFSESLAAPDDAAPALDQTSVNGDLQS